MDREEEGRVCGGSGGGGGGGMGGCQVISCPREVPSLLKEPTVAASTELCFGDGRPNKIIIIRRICVNMTTVVGITL